MSFETVRERHETSTKHKQETAVDVSDEINFDFTDIVVCYASHLNLYIPETAVPRCTNNFEAPELAISSSRKTANVFRGTDSISALNICVSSALYINNCCIRILHGH
jgi:hypothetical protein